MVHLANRTAASRLQFIQRPLTGPRTLVWQVTAYGLLHTLGGLELGRMDFAGLPDFYHKHFRIWNFFKITEQQEQNTTLTTGKATGLWYVSEHLWVDHPGIVQGFALVGDLDTPAAGGHAGMDLLRAEGLAVHFVKQLLHHWSSTLSSEECVQL